MLVQGTETRGDLGQTRSHIRVRGNAGVGERERGEETDERVTDEREKEIESLPGTGRILLLDRYWFNERRDVGVFVSLYRFPAVDTKRQRTEGKWGTRIERWRTREMGKEREGKKSRGRG